MVLRSNQWVGQVSNLLAGLQPASCDCEAAVVRALPKKPVENRLAGYKPAPLHQFPQGGSSLVWPLALICLLAACGKKPVDLPDYGFVPAFRLTAQSGDAFDSRSLEGKIWVADFIFTNCPGPCPRMTSQMHQVQQAVVKMRDVRLVSFTVDPARDTPAVLAGYARVHHASPELWYFLTGPQAALNDLCRNVFKLGNVDGTLMHSTRFILIDRKSHIRGYYDTSESESIPHLVADIHVLAAERS